MYLLDTDILSNLLKRAPSIALLGHLASVPTEQQLTSAITVGEFLYGAHRLEEGGVSLLARIEATILANLQVLPFDVPAAQQYGALRAHLERQGSRLDDADLRIASIALARDLTLVTANVRHFQRVPRLRIENWLDE